MYTVLALLVMRQSAPAATSASTTAGCPNLAARCSSLDGTV